MAVNDRCSWFTRFASATAHASGKPATFFVAVCMLIVWAATGPFFHFGDTWQLVINTGTTIITFLMVFLIQNTQNRDSEAIHIKLDELIHVIEKANNALLDIEELDQKELDKMRDDFEKIATDARKSMRSGS
ncbi:MAG: putative small integral rane protein precursor [Phycisphaerales bacterium]|nr:putative small integral rane protein precursor [Phycisphaerales bacterium]